MRPPIEAGPPATGGALNEAQLLLRARQTVASAPAEALARCAEHGQRYPYGALAQEREVIGIEALTRLGRKAEAVERARRFFESYPKSAYRPRVEVLVGR